MVLHLGDQVHRPDVLQRVREALVPAAQEQGALLRRALPVPHLDDRPDLDDRGRHGQELLGGRAEPAEPALQPRGQPALRHRPLPRAQALPQLLVAQDAAHHQRRPQHRRHALRLPHHLQRRAQPVLLPGRDRARRDPCRGQLRRRHLRHRRDGRERQRGPRLRPAHHDGQPGRPLRARHRQPALRPLPPLALRLGQLHRGLGRVPQRRRLLLREPTRTRTRTRTLLP